MIYTINFSLLFLKLIFVIFYFRKINFFRLNIGPPHFSKKFALIWGGAYIPRNTVIQKWRFNIKIQKVKIQ